MSDEPRPSISSVDARVGRLEEAQSRLEATQLKQDGVMNLIQLEQTHIREIMSSRFVGLEAQMQAQSSKLDTFMGRMEALIAEGLKQQADLEATPLGRLVDERLNKVEAWKDVSVQFHSEVRGMAKVVAAVTGTSILAFAASVFAILNSMGVIR